MIPNRNRILIEALANAQPGIHVRRIAAITGLSWNTCRHHVGRLTRSGALTTLTYRGRTCVFPPHRQKRLPAVDDALQRRILDWMRANPGQPQRALAQALDIACSVAHRRILQLEEANLVRRVAEGRSMLCYVTNGHDEVRAAIHAGPTQLLTGALA